MTGSNWKIKDDVVQVARTFGGTRVMDGQSLLGALFTVKLIVPVGEVGVVELAWTVAVNVTD